MQYSFRGSPEQVGHQHGESLRREIGEVFEIYRALWGKSAAQIARLGQCYFENVAAFSADLASEMQGIAEGANLPPSTVAAINARTELLGHVDIAECTAVGISPHTKRQQHVVIAQNWDWMRSFRSLTRVIEIKVGDRPRLRLLIEPGMIGKIGLSDAGVGVCFNYLPTISARTDGIPVHVLLRAIVESADAHAAIALLKRTTRAANANYLVADADGTIASIETRADRVNVISGVNYVSHTNSFNADGDRCGRQLTFEQALERYIDLDGAGELSPDALKTALAEPGVQFPLGSYGGDIETIHAVVVNLSASRFLVSDGAATGQFTLYE